MNLYDVIPENLFSILASKNKNLYVKTLFVLLEAFKQHLKISKNELISMINAQLDDDIFSADFTEEELLESEQSISGKVYFLVRKLKSTGWILIETESDFQEYITVPGFSYKIIQLLYDIANVSESENFAYVYSTYSSLKLADETRDPFEMVTALNDGAERTEQLVESLKSVYHSITYYNQQLISTLNVNNVLHSHYEIYQEEVVSRILRPLKIRDSVPKYKIPMQNILKKWLVEDDVIDGMVRYRLSKQKDGDEEKLRNDILCKIHYIIDTYDNLDKKFIGVIDEKNRRYTRATTQKIDYLINSDQSVKGNLILLLKYLSDDEKADKAFHLINDSFELYEQSFVSDESLYEKKRAVRRTRNSELIMTEEPSGLAANAKTAAMQMLNNKYSKKNVNEYVDRLFGNKNEITSRDIVIENDDDYIMTLLSAVQVNERGSGYTIEFADEDVVYGRYEIPFMTYRKRGAK